MTLADARPGKESAPWTDDMGWLSQLNSHMRLDMNTDQKFWKDSTVRVTTDALRGIRLSYSLTVTRDPDDGRVTTFIEYIDELGKAVRIILPGEVTTRVESLADRLRTENRSRKSREAAFGRGLGKEKIDG